MTFAYEKGRAVDQERDCELRANYGFRDGEYTYRFLFRLGDIKLNMAEKFSRYKTETVEWGVGYGSFSGVLYNSVGCSAEILPV